MLAASSASTPASASAPEVTLRLIEPASVPEFAGLYERPVAKIEYKSKQGDLFTRDSSLAGLIAVEGTRDVAQAVRALNSEVLKGGTASGPISAALLQAADGSFYGARALASTNFAPIGPMPLDATGFGAMPYGTGSAYDPAHVVVSTQYAPIRGFVGYTSWVDTSAGTGAAQPLPEEV